VPMEGGKGGGCPFTITLFYFFHFLLFNIEREKAWSSIYHSILSAQR
jgi:hypothetical protein